MAEQGPIVFCTGGGCTAKLGAGVLSRILESCPGAKKTPTFWLATTAGMMRRLPHYRGHCPGADGGFLPADGR